MFEEKVDPVNDSEVVKLIDSKDYFVFINFMMCGSDQFVNVLENEYFMEDNNDKFIMVLMQPGKVDMLPVFITLFKKSEVTWEQIMTLSQKLDINFVSDNDKLYYAPYHKNVAEQLALQSIRSFTENFYKKNKGVG